MIPFVAAGGLLIALGFLFGGYDIALKPGADRRPHLRRLAGPTRLRCAKGADSIGDLALAAGWGAGVDYLGAVLFTIGGGGLRLPRAGAVRLHRLRASPTVPASPPASSAARSPCTLGAGFLGGIVSGLLAGVIALWIALAQGAALAAPA